MMELAAFHTWTALVTPMTYAGAVDFECLRRLVDVQEEAKNGVLILGSTGEALNLDPEERRKILTFVASRKRSTPLMVGVGGVHLGTTLEWLRFLESADVDAYLMVTPLYAKPGAIGQTKWFETLFENVTRPCMLYNIPGRTGIALSLEAVRTLNSHPRFWSIKEASGRTADFSRYVEAAGGKDVLSGDDALLPDFAPLGAKGLVSVAGNVWPEETHAYTRLTLEGSMEHADLWKWCSQRLFTASNPVPVKALMHEKGLLSSPVVRLPLHAGDLAGRSELVEADARVRQWFMEYAGVA